MPGVFVSLCDGKIATLIDGASGRVALAVPGVRMKTAEAVNRAFQRLGQENVGIVVDCGEEVFHLGYGDFEALMLLQQSGCRVRQSVGLRVGVLVCDNAAWTFAPTALYVEAEVHSDETPNAVTLTGSSVDRIASRIFETSTPWAATDIPRDPSGSHHEPGPEIGVEPVSQEELSQARDALKAAPPIPFDIARQVRVFEPYIQYVEITLRGCAIQRHRVEVPRSIQRLDRKDEMGSRLRTTFELIESNSKVSSKQLEAELKQIRDDFTRSLGKSWGRVILRAARNVFDQRIAVFRERLEAHRQSVEQSLGTYLEQSRTQLVDYFLPIAAADPPDSLLGQLTGSPAVEQVREWLDSELLRVFPEPSDLVSEMSLDVQFRDVTYETLNEEGFGEKLREAYPHVALPPSSWDT